MDYYIYLKRTKEYIVETDDDLIWTRTRDITYAFNDTSFERINNLAQFICKDKQLSHKDVEIIGEEVIIQTTVYPVGTLRPLYYIGNQLASTLDELHHMVEKYGNLYELDELTFDELYYTIDTVQELMDWCTTNGYEWYELEKAFGIKIWETTLSNDKTL